MTMAAETLPDRFKHRSALEAFACPLYFKTRYVDGLEDHSPPALRGSAFHNVIRRYIELLVEYQCSSDLDLAKRAFEEGIAESMVSMAIVDEVDRLFWRIAEGWELDVESVLLVETRPDDEYRWQPDLVRVYESIDTLEITDFKSHFQILAEHVARDSFQAKFYSARARRIWPGFARYRFVFWFVRWNVLVAVEFTQADIDRHEEHVRLTELGIAQALASNTWPAVPGETCGFCRIECPVAADARVHPIRVTTPHEAQRALGEYLALQNAADARRKALSDWCKFEGGVALNGLEIAHRPAAETSFPADRVFEVFQQHGLTPTFSISKSALKPWLTTRRFKHVATDLEALRVEKASTAFRVKKVGDVAPESPSEGAE